MQVFLEAGGQFSSSCKRLRSALSHALHKPKFHSGSHRFSSLPKGGCGQEGTIHRAETEAACQSFIPMAVPVDTQGGFASAGVERPLAMGMTSASSPVTGMPAVATEASAHCNYVPTGVIFVMPSGETIVGRRCQDLAQEQESRRRNARPTVTLHNASPNSSFRVTSMPRSPIYREEVRPDTNASNFAAATCAIPTCNAADASVMSAVLTCDLGDHLGARSLRHSTCPRQTLPSTVLM